jgi:hypothetical protein
MSNKNEPLRDEVLAALSDAPQTIAAIYAACQTAEDHKQVANALFYLRQTGLAGSAGRGLYVRGTGEYVRAPTEPEARAPRAKRAVVWPASPKALAPGPRGGATETILRKLVADTQDALDAYLMSIGDPHILTPLREARDQARIALAHLEGEAA